MRRLAVLFLLLAVPAQAWTRKPLFQVIPGSPFTGGGGSGSVTFPLLAPAGSAAAPSYSFSTASNTGLWLFSTNFLVIQGSDATGTDIAGGSITVNAGRGTGTGLGGSYFVALAPSGTASNATRNTSQNVLAFSDANLAIGAMDTHTAGSAEFAAYDRAAGDTDSAGSSAIFRSGQGTGTGNGGILQIQIAPPAAGTGTTQNALQTVLQATPSTGDVSLNGALAGAGPRGAIGLGTIATGSNLKLDRTVTAAGTTGARTIDKMAGTVNFAIAAASIVVTDALVTTSSIVFGVMRTADATCTDIKSIVPIAGSFTITLNAGCAAETSVGFWVVN